MSWLSSLLSLLPAKKYPTGALFDPRLSSEKAEDWKHEELTGGAAPLYLSSKPVLASNYPQEDQKQTNECGPHAATLAIGIFEEKTGGRFIRLSKDFFYRMRSNFPDGGMYLQELGSIGKNYGSCSYSAMPTSPNDDLANQRVLTDDLVREAAVFKAGGYFQFQNPTDIDSLASVLASGRAVILFIYGTYEEWAREYPVVFSSSLSASSAPVRHFITALPGASFVDGNGKKHLTIQDSVPFGGTSIRRLSEDFIQARVIGALYFTDLALTPGQGIKPTHQFSSGMEIGNRGPEVLWLQKCLAYEGLLPQNALTGYYGPLTAASVKGYQTKYAGEILLPLGLTSPTGRVGSSTIKHLNTRYA